LRHADDFDQFRSRAAGRVGQGWLSYNEQTWLAKRHALGREAEASIGSLTAALAGLAAAATGSQ